MGEFPARSVAEVDTRDTEELISGHDKEDQSKPGKCVSVMLSVVLVVACVGSLVSLVAWILANPASNLAAEPCEDPCTIILAESMPLNLTFSPGSPHYQSTYNVWKALIADARHTIDISSYYWTLRGSDVYNDTSDDEGEDIFRELMAAGTKRNVKIRIVENKPSKYIPDDDTTELMKHGAADVRSLDFDQLMGGGILHTKAWVVDGKHIYIGSANMDYRALTQVKEVGVGVFNCSCLAQDLEKLFEVYWYLGNQTKVPPTWPQEYATLYDINSQFQLKLNGTNATVFIGSSPPPFCPSGRTSDIDGLLHVIESATKYVYVAVMDYMPEKEFASPEVYWDVIDAKLRAVAFNKHIHVRVMGSIWNHTKPDMIMFLKSLAILGTSGDLSIEVKLFTVPAVTPAEHKIPYSRVNHNKYMVTDNAAYVGTSNWSGNYFTKTAGASIVVSQTMAETNATTLQKQLTQMFERDWFSDHAQPIL